jgi:hypothetical protein
MANIPDQSENKSGFKAGRPRMPAGYGIQPLGDGNDLVPFKHVEERLSASRNYWVCSASSHGVPHAMPVWGVWLDGAVYFSTDPQSRKGRNLAANPEVVIHLESGDDVVILEGVISQAVDLVELQAADRYYFDKYEFHLVGDWQNPGPVYRLRPRKIFAWLEKSYPSSATRFRLKGADSG